VLRRRRFGRVLDHDDCAHDTNDINSRGNDNRPCHLNDIDS
jgi:hypothetical protein